MKALGCLLAVLALCGTTAAATPPRSVTAPAPVTALAFDSLRVAYASGDAAGDCDRVRVWNLKTRVVTKLGRKTHCEATSTGRGIATLALAGGRALWLHYVGGNIREWSLWTATTTRPEPRQLRFAEREVEDPGPIVVGDGDSSRLGDILPYAVDRIVVALRANGARRYSWTAPTPVVALSALGGELAVASEGGVVTVLDAGGKVLRTAQYDGEIGAVRIVGTAVLVQHGRVLELRTVAGTRTWRLPSGAVLAAATSDHAYYVHRGRVHRLWLSSRRDDVVASGLFVQAEGPNVALALARRVDVRPAF